MSLVTPRKRDAEAAKLPDRQEKLQAESRELQAKLRAYQERVPVLEQNRERAQSHWMFFADKCRSGEDDRIWRSMQDAKAMVDEYKEDWRVLLERIKTTSSRIQAIESELKEICRPYIERLLSEGPPSQVEKEGLYKVQMRGIQTLYDCSFPAHAQPPLPLTLAHPVFAEFCDDVSDESLPLDDRVCDFVIDLCFNVLGRMSNFTDEAELNRAFNGKLSEFLDIRAVTMDSVTCGGKTALTDGMLKTVHGQLLLFLELEFEKGSTLVQGLQTFGIYTGSVNEKCKLIPCFFMEVIGPTIRIGGLVSFEKVAWQPLTPFMNCFFREHDRKDMVTLCRAMLALKKGVIALEKYYNVQLSSNTITPKDVPYPLQGKQSVRFGNKLVFKVTLDSDNKQIFKYCRRYGEEVHRSWANAGLAPSLHSCKPIAGGWLEVQMEYLEDYSNAFSLFSDLDGTAKHQLQAAVSKAWAEASAIQVGGCLVAHGDMRPPNIMAKRDVKRDSWEIKFIDFDWAGKVGVDRYPAFMNKMLPWHPNVGAGKFLEQCHDKWCLEQEGFWNVMTTAGWHSEG